MRRIVRRSTTLRRLCRRGLVPFVLACSGCYSWQDVDLSRLSGDERPDRARVVLEDGTGHVLFEPRIIAADSVFGYAEAADSAAAAWPLGDIARVQVRAVNPVVTGGVIIGAMTVGFILACSSTGCSPF